MVITWRCRAVGNLYSKLELCSSVRLVDGPLRPSVSGMLGFLIKRTIKKDKSYSRLAVSKKMVGLAVSTAVP